MFLIVRISTRVDSVHYFSLKNKCFLDFREREVKGEGERETVRSYSEKYRSAASCTPLLGIKPASQASVLREIEPVTSLCVGCHPTKEGTPTRALPLAVESLVFTIVSGTK